MAQDYAKLRNRPTARDGKSRSATRAAPAPSTHWSWYISGVISGLFAVFVGYIGIANFNNGTDNATVAPATTVNEDDVPTFDFYNQLANATIEVDQPAQATAATPGVTTTGTQPAVATTAVDMREYLLQAGSFQDQTDAESRRAKIILLNMNANVVPGVVAGRKWMRVQVGPFNGRQAAESARALLSENNIDSIPLIVR